jgi:DNA-binding NtrC family response regulator
MSGKILIADDEPSVRDSVGYALEQEGSTSPSRSTAPTPRLRASPEMPCAGSCSNPGE